jgi:peptidoglycan/xylan/chitin deacetylase (PgdA/CDA1 family)
MMTTRGHFDLRKFSNDMGFPPPISSRRTRGYRQIRNLDQHGEVGGHTVSHADLSRLSIEGQRAEIATNKHFLESVVGHPIRCFAYPYGAFTSNAVRIVGEISYDGAVLSRRMTSPRSSVHPYQIPRIQVLGTQKLPEFVTCAFDDFQCSVFQD